MAEQTNSSVFDSKSPDSANMTERYINTARRLLQQLQDVISGNASMSLQFNHGQCVYLVDKLKPAVQCAVDCTSSHGQASKFSKNGKLLVCLAIEIMRLVEGCCQEARVQAASMFMNIFEHVASLISQLELCMWSFRNRHKIILGKALRLALTCINESHYWRLTRSQALDSVNLFNYVDSAFKLASISDRVERELITSLRGKLEATLANDMNPDVLESTDLPDLSFHDQVKLLNIVEASLISESIQNPEERHFAAALLKRLGIVVANRTPHTPNVALLSILEGEDKRLVQEESLASSAKKSQLATSRSLLETLRKTVAASVSQNWDLMSVDYDSLYQREKLGKGSAGDVNKVKWMGIHAAEKTFPDGKALRYFKPEVSILAKLSHPNIVPLFCYVNEESRCSIVIELMEKDLAKLMEERSTLNETRGYPFSVDEAVDLMLQIAEGMHYLHRKRVLHRDLKSHNILVKLVKMEGVEFILAKVADFGISRTKEKSITLNHPTWNRGTTAWMAPELTPTTPVRSSVGNQIGSSDMNNVTWYPFKSDVYSFGMVCYEILTGRVPFEKTLAREVKEKGWDDPYVPRTHEGLLKWKYAHMNSVDFMLQIAPSGNQYLLKLMDSGKLRQLDHAKVVFPEGADVPNMVNKIIECSYDPELETWSYMRMRPDKDTPNAYHVYLKVMGSIKDNITEEDLQEEFQDILRLPLYTERIARDEQAARQAHHARRR